MDFPKLVEDSHRVAAEHGFWGEDGYTRDKYKALVLLISELIEFVEAHRRGDKDGMAEELSDATIRLADYCGGFGIDLNPGLREPYDIDKAITFIWFLIENVVALAESHSPFWEANNLAWAIWCLAAHLGIDIERAIAQKMAINENRPYLHGKEY